MPVSYNWPMKKLILFALLFGCADYPPIDTRSFEMGMTKGEIYQAVKNRGKPIGAIQYEHGTIEVISVSRLNRWDSQVAEEYYLYFLNDRFEKWGMPGDWRKEADQFYEIRYRK